MTKGKYYITTPIYYPSGKWHLGTCYTTVVCDAIARFKRMDGYDTFYLTGTDEHGKKILSKAEEGGITPKQFVDNTVASLKELWDLLKISYDKFIRTTDEDHKEIVAKIFTKLYEQGDIYKSEYEGLYCVPCESFWTKSQLVDGKCPDCGREVEITKEESYFFRLSKYQDRLIDLIENNPEFLEPKSRQNEMLNNFLKAGLQDLAVSRTTFDWGIKVPFDPKHVVYVWIDALTNYITALGYMGKDDSLFKKYWPADLHMMGKEIVRFHSIIWPAILMALDIPLPKKVYGHGWLLLGGEKASKSKGNVVDPFLLCERYGVDAVRYYLLREIPFGNDGTYSNYAFLNRINVDLCNDLGNLVSRTTAMIQQYFGGEIVAPSALLEQDKELVNIITGAYDKVRNNIDRLMVPEALEVIFNIASRCNKYIDETTPWILSKTEEGKERLKRVMFNLVEAIRVIAILLKPFLIDTHESIIKAIGLTDKNLMTFESTKQLQEGVIGSKVVKGQHLFSRIDIDKELKELDIIEEKQKSSEMKNNSEKKVEENAEGVNTVSISEITIDQFDSIKLKVAKVVKCEKVEKADKLLKLTLEVGGAERTVVSGIAKHYTPEEMVGKSVVIVSNLKPCKLRGIMSEGMILCAVDDDGGFSLVTPERSVKSGAEVC